MKIFLRRLTAGGITCIFLLLSCSILQTSETGTYVHKDPNFSIKYPSNWSPAKKFSKYNVLSVRGPRKLPTLSVSVGDLGKERDLTMSPKIFIMGVKKLFPKTSEHRVLSSKIITLDDGTKAIEARISWLWKDGLLELTTSLLTAHKGDKWVSISSTGMPLIPYDKLVKLTHGIKFH